MDLGLKNLSFSDLEIMAKLSDHQSLRALCRSTHIEPSKMSKTLSKIKFSLRVELIKTSPHGYILTPEGSYISQQAKEIIKKTEDLIPSKNSLKSLTETYTIGSRGFLNLRFTQNILKPLSTQKIQCRFLDLSPDELKTMAFDGVLDVAIHLEPISWPQTEISLYKIDIMTRNAPACPKNIRLLVKHVRNYFSFNKDNVIV